MNSEIANKDPGLVLGRTQNMHVKENDGLVRKDLEEDRGKRCFWVQCCEAQWEDAKCLNNGWIITC